MSPSSSVFPAEPSSATFGIGALAELRLLVHPDRIEIPNNGARGAWRMGGNGYASSVRQRAIQFSASYDQVVSAWRVTDPEEKARLGNRPRHTKLWVAKALVRFRDRRMTVVNGVTDGPLWLEEELGWCWCTDPDRAVAIRLRNLPRTSHVIPALPEFLRECTVYVSLANPEAGLAALNAAGIPVSERSPETIPARLDAPPPFACWQGIRFPPLLSGPPNWALRGEAPPVESWLDPGVPPHLPPPGTDGSPARAVGGLLSAAARELESIPARRAAAATVEWLVTTRRSPALAVALVLQSAALSIAIAVVTVALVLMAAFVGSSFQDNRFWFVVMAAVIASGVLVEVAQVGVHLLFACLAARLGDPMSRAASWALLALGFLPAAGVTTVPVAWEMTLRAPVPRIPDDRAAGVARRAAVLAIAAAVVAFAHAGILAWDTDTKEGWWEAFWHLGRFFVGPAQAFALAWLAHRLVRQIAAGVGGGRTEAYMLGVLALCLLCWPHPLAFAAEGAVLVAWFVIRGGTTVFEVFRKA